MAPTVASSFRAGRQTETLRVGTRESARGMRGMFPPHL